MMCEISTDVCILSSLFIQFFVFGNLERVLSKLRELLIMGRYIISVRYIYILKRIEDFQD